MGVAATAKPAKIKVDILPQQHKVIEVMNAIASLNGMGVTVEQAIGFVESVFKIDEPRSYVESFLRGKTLGVIEFDGVETQIIYYSDFQVLLAKVISMKFSERNAIFYGE